MPVAPGFGLYVHFPFCLSKCPYCDFNSHVRERIDAASWQRAILAELAHYAQQTPGRTLTSIFFGGGTPSLMPEETAAAVIAAARAAWPADPDLEVTLEANPGAVDAQRFAGYRDAGVNRLSIGVQSLDDRALKFLGRRHDAGEARRAIELARKIFPRISFDLIYALPDQTLDAWMGELDTAIALAADHLSVYQLTIEPGTQFHTDHRLGRLAVMDDDAQANLYEATQDRLARAGLPAYEISNHAVPAAQSRHNLTYWRYGDYVGIGPGAHGRLTDGSEKFATRQVRLPEQWHAAVAARGHGTEERTALDMATRKREMLLMGLRLAEGVDRRRFADETGADVMSAVDPDAARELAASGLLVPDDRRLVLSPSGRQLLNAVLGRLIR
ncbi:MAG: radical SAM family heme chaperone HemW [Alphaproteobacteria bacterium]